MQPSQKALLLALLGLGLLLAGGSPEESSPRQEVAPSERGGVEFFEKRVRPVLVEKCFKCHSAQAEKLKGSFRLDTREALLKGGDSGPAILPGNPDQSLLVRAIRYADEDLRMPPKGKLPPDQIEDIAAWISMGAPDPRTAAGPPGPERPAVDFAKARQFWSFQPIRSPAIPTVKLKDWPRNSIDRFILEKLEEKGLRPARDADKRTLLRRTSFDLIGLPPTPEEIDAFLRDNSTDAFARVVDRLLASPHYGERWGRYWLDVVRYADTCGNTADFPVPQAWLYRNYVIQAFNHDKPYDEFLREQVAGDLLPFQAGAERREQVVATGYLAIARRFGDRPRVTDHLTMEDAIDTMGKSVLGLSLGCARCHDHKFDPIPQEDYYALYGILASTRFPFPGGEDDKQPKDLVPMVRESISATREDAEALLKAFEEGLAKADADIRRCERERRSLQSKGAKDQIKAADAALASARKQRQEYIDSNAPQVDRVYAVSEGTPHDERVQKKGEPKNPGRLVPRGFLQILGRQKLPTGASGSGRLELAGWLTDRGNPLTARVMVNRIWQRHFGKGIVLTPNDFGDRGRRPTHPELLDYLAARFIESGWSIKAMHRLIMSSRTYRLAGRGASAEDERDPNNDLLASFPRQRLDAESLRDAVLSVSGDLDPTPGGPHPFPLEAKWGFTQHFPFIAVYDTRQRSVYVMQQRNKRHPYFEAFDGADPNASCAQRTPSTTALQALFFMNSPFVHEQSQKLAGRLIAAVPDLEERIRFAYELALGRPATLGEVEGVQTYLRKYRTRLKDSNVDEAEARRKAWASVVRALLGSNEFLFVN